MKPPPRPRPRIHRPGLNEDDRQALIAPEEEAEDRAKPEPRAEAERSPAPITQLAARAKETLRRDHSPVTSLNRVRDERRRAVWHARKRYAYWAAGAIVLIAALVWGAFFSPLFALTTIKVKTEGPEVSESAVTAVLEPYRGTPLPRLSTGDMRAAVEALTVVETVQIARSWPKEVIVTVKGREAVAAQQLADSGEFELLDAHGVVLGKRGEAPEGIPVISVGGEEHLRGALVQDVLTTLGALPDEVRSRLSSAAIDGDGLMSFTLDNSARVIWGGSNDTELKSRVLQVLLTQEAKVYDVSAPRTPVTK
ncbi:cell division protein FtsQ/DivIB [Bowdeniella massiliensis]|uniref:cell division protein FtsQ/DivIB n=1 Tax=Bowdeniella massiliensis TaxID=2932264 RepID=UPI002027824C